jgi:hypothetical protein
MGLTLEELKHLPPTFLIGLSIWSVFYTSLLVIMNVILFYLPEHIIFSQSCKSYQEISSKTSALDSFIIDQDPVCLRYICTETPLWLYRIAIGVLVIYFFYSVQKFKNLILISKVFKSRDEADFANYIQKRAFLAAIQAILGEILGYLLLVRASNVNDVISTSAVAIGFSENDEMLHGLVVSIYLNYKGIRSGMVDFAALVRLEIEIDPNANESPSVM